MANRTDISKIDANITPVQNRLRALATIDESSAASWQAAWDAHPDLRAEEMALFAQRGALQRELALQEYRAAMAAARIESRAFNRKKSVCSKCGQPTFAAA